MFGGERDDVGVGVGLGLFEEGDAAALIEPGGDAAGEGAVARAGEDGDLAAAGLGVVLLHCGLAGGELLLDLGALVAADAGKLLVGVTELVVVELKLGLGDVEVVGVGDGAVGSLQGGGEGVDVGLVFFDEGLELRDLLLDGEGVASESAGLEGGLAESEGEGLVNFVVGETLGFVGEGLLFGGDGEGGKGLDGLPGTLVDEGVRGLRASASEKGQVRHGPSGQPGTDKARDEEGRWNCNCEAAKKLHSSTLHGWMRALNAPKGCMDVGFRRG